MANEGYHEPYELLPAETRDLHRAIVSLMEELEAVDWYGQRVAVTEDAELKGILAHNRGEEIEHAHMVLEWIRRQDGGFDEMARRFLFRPGPIVAAEEAAGEAGSSAAPAGAPAVGSLGIGSLKGKL